MFTSITLWIPNALTMTATSVAPPKSRVVMVMDELTICSMSLDDSNTTEALLLTSVSESPSEPELTAT